MRIRKFLPSTIFFFYLVFVFLNSNIEVSLEILEGIKIEEVIY